MREVQPKIFVAENVEGLYFHNGGQTLCFMTKEFEKLGYTIQSKILNASKYGVPQKRKRLIILGTKPNYRIHYPTEKQGVKTMRDALANVPKSKGASYSAERKAVYDMVPPGGCWVDLPKSIQKEFMGKSYSSGGGKRGIARRLSWDEPCLTILTSPMQKQTERIHPDETRPLTVRESARIQTFPDDWKFSGSMASQYRQVGNAVPVLLAYEIALCVKDALSVCR